MPTGRRPRPDNLVLPHRSPPEAAMGTLHLARPDSLSRPPGGLEIAAGRLVDSRGQRDRRDSWRLRPRRCRQPTTTTPGSRAWATSRSSTACSGFFANFSVAFTYLSPMVGIYSLFVLGVGTGGPAYIWLTFIPVIGMLFVALVFGELASHYPVAGALYQYWKFSVGPGYGWFVGWFYGIRAAGHGRGGRHRRRRATSPRSRTTGSAGTSIPPTT